MWRCDTRLRAVQDPLQKEVNAIAEQVHFMKHIHVTVAMAEVRRGDEVFRVAATSGAYGNQLDNVYSNLLAKDEAYSDAGKTLTHVGFTSVHSPR